MFIWMETSRWYLESSNKGSIVQNETSDTADKHWLKKNRKIKTSLTTFYSKLPHLKVANETPNYADCLKTRQNHLKVTSNLYVHHKPETYLDDRVELGRSEGWI